MKKLLLGCLVLLILFPLLYYIGFKLWVIKISGSDGNYTWKSKLDSQFETVPDEELFQTENYIIAFKPDKSVSLINKKNGKVKNIDNKYLDLNNNFIFENYYITEKYLFLTIGSVYSTPMSTQIYKISLNNYEVVWKSDSYLNNADCTRDEWGGIAKNDNSANSLYFSVSCGKIVLLDVETNSILKSISTNESSGDVLVSSLDKLLMFNKNANNFTFYNLLTNNTEFGDLNSKFVQIYQKEGYVFIAEEGDKLRIIDPSSLSNQGLVDMNAPTSVLYADSQKAFIQTDAVIYKVDMNSYSIVDKYVLTERSYEMGGANYNKNLNVFFYGMPGCIMKFSINNDSNDCVFKIQKHQYTESSAGSLCPNPPTPHVADTVPTSVTSDSENLYFSGYGKIYSIKLSSLK